MHHKRGRPPAARAGCAMCKPWKVSGAHAAKHRAVAARRVDFATVEQVDEWWHTRREDEAMAALAEYEERHPNWMDETWQRSPFTRNPWQVPPLELVQERIRQRAARVLPAPQFEPAWGLMAHAFIRGA